MSERYAVFFSPDDSSDLANFGVRALGRHANGCAATATSDDFTDRQVADSLSAIPAHYGFHATLKAPFCLSDNSSEVELLDAVKSLAQQQTPIIMDSLQPLLLSGFMALGFDAQHSAIGRLAEQCVEQLECCRAPLTNEDLRKRNPQQLNDAQREYLFQYGYPYVFNEFLFHMTLTGQLQLPEHASYVDWLSALYFRLVPQAPVLDRLSVFWQPDRDTAFTRLAEFTFS